MPRRNSTGAEGVPYMGPRGGGGAGARGGGGGRDRVDRAGWPWRLRSGGQQPSLEGELACTVGVVLALHSAAPPLVFSASFRQPGGN